MQNSDKRIVQWLILALSVGYALLAPYTYFRHDDWIHLGNSVVILPKDWSFLWTATQFTDPRVESVWFFRPFVKGLVYLAFQAFGFHHPLWVFLHWALLLLATAIGAKSLKVLDPNNRNAFFFWVLMLASIAFHFASVVWVGEGIMNAPQLVMMSLSLLFWAKNLKHPRKGTLTVSCFTFLLALGFKESSVFLPGLFLAILAERALLKTRLSSLIPHALISVGYLVFRLGYLPVNPGYKPILTFEMFWIPLGYFVGILLLTAVVWYVWRAWANSPVPFRSQKLLWFVPFLFITIGPHLGHNFFSPGWLIFPGFFFAWTLAYLEPWPNEIPMRHSKSLVVLLLLVSSAPVLWKIIELDWIHWHRSQKQVHKIIAAISERPEGRIVVDPCNTIPPKGVYFHRVIGAGINLEHIWMLNHPDRIRINVKACFRGEQPYPGAPGEIVTRWDYPNFTRVK